MLIGIIEQLIEDLLFDCNAEGTDGIEPTTTNAIKTFVLDEADQVSVLRLNFSGARESIPQTSSRAVLSFTECVRPKRKGCRTLFPLSFRAGSAETARYDFETFKLAATSWVIHQAVPFEVITMGQVLEGR
jgi:hypothetical protein